MFAEGWRGPISWSQGLQFSSRPRHVKFRPLTEERNTLGIFTVIAAWHGVTSGQRRPMQPPASMGASFAWARAHMYVYVHRRISRVLERVKGLRLRDRASTLVWPPPPRGRKRKRRAGTVDSEETRVRCRVRPRISDTERNASVILFDAVALFINRPELPAGYYHRPLQFFTGRVPCPKRPL